MTWIAAARYRLTLPNWAATVVVVLVGGYAAVLGWAMTHSTYDMWGGLIIAPVLVGISLPILARAGRLDPDPRIGPLLIVALLLKLMASLGRYYVAFYLYDGRADANAYHHAGIAIAEEFRQGEFAVDLGRRVIGTGFVQLVTGGIYSITRPSLIGGFLVFAWLGYWGLYHCYRAYAIAFPDQQRMRYAVLLFLMPSMLFWPSSIGKDSWMLLTLGLFAHGTARLLAHKHGAVPLLALGAVGQLMVRPHVTVLAVSALVIAYLIRRRPARLAALGPIKSVITWAVLGIVGLVVIGQAQSFFGADEFSSQAVNNVFNETQRRTTGGGASISDDTPEPGGLNPLNLPTSVITVLYRPFPFEAHNFQSLLAAAEGAVLLLLTVMSWRRLASIPGRMRSEPYVTWCLFYCLLFCYAFGHFQNFAIITRERVQVFPFVFVLLALPTLKGAAGGRSPLTAPFAHAFASRGRTLR